MNTTGLSILEKITIVGGILGAILLWLKSVFWIPLLLLSIKMLFF